MITNVDILSGKEFKPYIENLSLETQETVLLAIDNKPILKNNIVSNKELKILLEIIEGFFTSKKISYLLNTNLYNDELKIIAYYFAMYYITFKKEHPFLKYERISYIIEFLKNCTVSDKYRGFELSDINDFYLLIDQHFKTKYKNCNYNILHFLSEKILVNRYYEVCY